MDVVAFEKKGFSPEGVSERQFILSFRMNPLEIRNKIKERRGEKR